VQRETDGVWIPADQRNVDWQTYQAWLALGNTPDAADPAPTPLTTQQVATALINGTDPVSVTLRGWNIVLAQKFGITNATAITAIVNPAN
jgi:hypothetical protein